MIFTIGVDVVSLTNDKYRSNVSMKEWLWNSSVRNMMTFKQVYMSSSEQRMAQPLATSDQDGRDLSDHASVAVANLPNRRVTPPLDWAYNMDRDENVAIILRGQQSRIAREFEVWRQVNK